MAKTTLRARARTAKATKSRRQPIDDLLAWARRFLPEYFCDEPAAFHAELLRDAADASKRLMVRVAPRGHAKSTCCAMAFPLWSICEQRSRNIVILSHESSLAVQVLRDIRDEIETNELLREHYGELCAAASADDAEREVDGADDGPRRKTPRRKWSESKFTTVSGITVHARGAGQALRGVRVGPHRPDLIICDDIEEDGQVATLEGREKLERWLRRVVLPALAPRGRIVVVGSLLHCDSLLANLRDKQRFPRWDYRVYRALEAEPDDSPGVAPGTFRLVALWPARWSVEKLQEERERVGTLAFEQEYMANPIDTSARLFAPAWLRRSEPAQLAGRSDLINLIAVDPSSGQDGGDFFALWVGSIDPSSGTIHTRELLLSRVGFIEQVRLVRAACGRWKPVRVGIETVGYQRALLQALKSPPTDDPTAPPLPLAEVSPTIGKRARIAASTIEYESGRFLLPADLSAEAERQFLECPGGRHDDAPDVCAMGIELSREFLRGSGIVVGALHTSRQETGW